MRVSAKKQAGRRVLRASGKVVSAWPHAVAADAGPMQIQLREGLSLRRAEAALQGTTRDTSRPEIGYGEKVSRRLSLSGLEEDFSTDSVVCGHFGFSTCQLKRTPLTSTNLV